MKGCDIVSPYELMVALLIAATAEAVVFLGVFAVGLRKYLKPTPSNDRRWISRATPYAFIAMCVAAAVALCALLAVGLSSPSVPPFVPETTVWLFCLGMTVLVAAATMVVVMSMARRLTHNHGEA